MPSPASFAETSLSRRVPLPAGGSAWCAAVGPARRRCCPDRAPLRAGMMEREGEEVWGTRTSLFTPCFQVAVKIFDLQQRSPTKPFTIPVPTTLSSQLSTHSPCPSTLNSQPTHLNPQPSPLRRSTGDGSPVTASAALPTLSYWCCVHGYLAHKKTPPRRTLQ